MTQPQIAARMGSDQSRQIVARGSTVHDVRGDQINNSNTTNNLWATSLAPSGMCSLSSKPSHPLLTVTIYVEREESLLKKLEPTEVIVSHHKLCLPETRAFVLQFIEHWALTPVDQHNILWLHGVAGSGKSTICTSAVETLRDAGCLGAFICFDRSTADTYNPDSIIRTLSYQLALLHNEVGSSIFAALENNPDILLSPARR